MILVAALEQPSIPRLATARDKWDHFMRTFGTSLKGNRSPSFSRRSPMSSRSGHPTVGLQLTAIALRDARECIQREKQLHPEQGWQTFPRQHGA